MRFPLKRVWWREKKKQHVMEVEAVREQIIDGIIRLAADAFEERALGMYEGFVVNLKEHIENLQELHKRELVDKMREIGLPGVCERCKTEIGHDGVNEQGKDIAAVKEGNVQYAEVVLGVKSRPLVGEPTTKGAPSNNNNGDKKSVESNRLNSENMLRSEIYPKLLHSLGKCLLFILLLH